MTAYGSFVVKEAYIKKHIKKAYKKHIKNVLTETYMNNIYE